MTGDMRPLMEEAYRVLEEGGSPIVIAPTSYGKTRASTVFYKRALSQGLAAGLIHVVPMRSLVHTIFEDHFKPLDGGYQSMDSFNGEHKSPYFLRHPVVTTLESYVWNVFRVPVAEFAKLEQELSEGHYYPVLASISTSINVFDEAHLYLGDETSLSHTSVTATLSYLARLDIPTVLETATMNPQAIADVVRSLASDAHRKNRRVKLLTLDAPDLKALVSAVEENVSRRIQGLFEASFVEDSAWVDENNFIWETRLERSEEEFLRRACNDAEDKLVLLFRNTVSKAKDSYINIKRECRYADSSSTVLVHGRLSNKDRARAEELLLELRRQERGIVVSTQVAEAGVDLNAHVVYTDAAPLENLVQRANRSCRRGRVLEHCRSEGGRLTVLLPPDDKPTFTGPYHFKEVEQTISLLRQYLEKARINWRVLAHGDTSIEVGPGNLISNLQRRGVQYGRHPALHRIVGHQLRAYHLYDPPPSSIFKLLKDIGVCSLLSEDMLVKVFLGENTSEYVTVSLGWLGQSLRRSNIVETDEHGNPFLLLVSNRKKIAKAPLPRNMLFRTRECGYVYNAIKNTVSSRARELRMGTVEWGFIASPGSYREGLGLISGEQSG